MQIQAVDAPPLVKVIDWGEGGRQLEMGREGVRCQVCRRSSERERILHSTPNLHSQVYNYSTHIMWEVIRESLTLIATLFPHIYKRGHPSYPTAPYTPHTTIVDLALA